MGCLDKSGEARVARMDIEVIGMIKSVIAAALTPPSYLYRCFEFEIPASKDDVRDL